MEEIRLQRVEEKQSWHWENWINLIFSAESPTGQNDAGTFVWCRYNDT